MMKYANIALAGLVGAIAPLAPPSPAADLTFVRAFPFSGPSGLAYDSRFCGLWVANETGQVVLVNLFGDELRRFATDLSRIDALAMENGDLLLTDGAGTYQRASITGEVRGAPFSMGKGIFDNDGLFVDPETQDTWVTDDSRSEVLRITAAGETEALVAGAALSIPLMEPQGITRDPGTGHLLVVDDADALDALFEFSADGALLDVIPLARGAVADAEAITLQPETGTLFIGFDDTDTIAVYTYAPTPTEAQVRATEPSGCTLSDAAGAWPTRG